MQDQQPECDPWSSQEKGRANSQKLSSDVHICTSVIINKIIKNLQWDSISPQSEQYSLIKHTTHKVQWHMALYQHLENRGKWISVSPRPLRTTQCDPLSKDERQRESEREGESKRAQKNNYMKISVNPLDTHTYTHTSTLNTDLQYHPATDSISPASPVEPSSLIARGTLSKLHETPYTPPLLFWAVRGVALVDQSFVRAA